MRIAEVIGTVTLSRAHPSLRGATWLVCVPQTLEDLRARAGSGGPSEKSAEPFVVYDDRGTHHGALIAVSEGAEASAPFHPDAKPIDAYNAAILDTIETD